MKVLIDAGADVNAKDIYNQTPLHVTKTAEQIKVLIGAGAIW